LIGHFSRRPLAPWRTSFDPIVIVAGLVPFIEMILVLLLVRNTEATRAVWFANLSREDAEN